MKNKLISGISLFLIALLLVSFIFAIGTTLITSDNIIDDDGYLDLSASCEPTSKAEYDGTTTFNITNATLYSSVTGTWRENKTLPRTGSSVGNDTYIFNFTNVINQSSQGEFKWNVLCWEQNISNHARINSVFAGNKTIKVQYAKPTVSSNPSSNIYDLDGNAITVTCTASPSANWNLTNVSLIVNQSGEQSLNQTHTPVVKTEGQIVANFTMNRFGNSSYPDGSAIPFSCMARQVKNISGGTENFVESEFSSSNLTIFVEYPPTITLNNPPTGNWSRALSTTLNWTVSNTFSDSDFYITRVWTNETGVWLPSTGAINVNNNTQQAYLYTFPDKALHLPFPVF